MGIYNLRRPVDACYSSPISDSLCVCVCVRVHVCVCACVSGTATVLCDFLPDFYVLHSEGRKQETGSVNLGYSGIFIHPVSEVYSVSYFLGGLGGGGGAGTVEGVVLEKVLSKMSQLHAHSHMHIHSFSYPQTTPPSDHTLQGHTPRHITPIRPHPPQPWRSTACRLVINLLVCLWLSYTGQLQYD